MSRYGRTWPTATDYTIAVQDAQSAFSHPELASAAVSADMFGLPLFASGQNAIAYQFVTNERTVAVRCFVREPLGAAQRYQALEQHLRTQPCDVLAPAHWHQEGIRVDNTWWPIVVMPWVPGRPLNLAVEAIADNQSAMSKLADRWRDLVVRLQSARVAHGDLQHGNVLVTDQLDLTLVDLDGVWVPSIPAGAPNENGHPNYQHPRRRSSDWGEHVDTFSAFMIELSLRSIAAEPALFREFAGGENLVFTQRDLLSPRRTPVWERVLASPDPQVRRSVALLERWCQHPEAPAMKVAALDQTLIALPDTFVAAPAMSAPSNSPLPASADWWNQEPVSAPASPAEFTFVQPAPGYPAPGAKALPTDNGQAVAYQDSGSRISLRAQLGRNAPLAGLVGGLVAGLIGSLVQGAVIPSPDGVAAAPVFAGLIAALLGGVLHSWQSFAGGAYDAGRQRLLLGGAVGAAAGLVSLIPADIVSRSLTTLGTERHPIAVALTWVIVSAAVGLAIGALSSARSSAAGAFGGALGGFLGGLIFGLAVGDFDRGLLVIDGLQPATALCAALVAGTVGLCIGLSARAVRRGTLTIIEGRGKGVEMLVSKRVATIGSSPRNTVVVSGDPMVQPFHAWIVLGKDGAQVEPLAAFTLNGRSVSAPVALPDGSVLAIGGTFIRFELN